MSMDNSNANMWKGALWPASVVGLAMLIGNSIWNQMAGFFGSALAGATVVVFLSVHLFIGRISRDMEPVVTMGLAMFSYFAKVLFMGAILFLVTKYSAPETVSRSSFAISALSIMFAWMTGEIRAFLKLRLHLPLPKKGIE